MAAEEKVIIRVEIDSDINNDLLSIERRLKRLEGRQKEFNRTSGKTDDRLQSIAKNSRGVAKHLDEAAEATQKLDKNTNRVNRRFGVMRSALRSVISPLRKFITTLSKISFIALAGQVGLFAAALVGVKVALLTGRAAVSLYNTALKGLSVTAASVVSGLAVAAAAIRQFSEVQMAANFGGGAAGRTAAARLSRGVTSQVRGLLGSENTAAIVGALARGGVRGNQNALIRQLFNITGGDGAAAQAIAQALAGKDVRQAQRAVEGAAGFQQGSMKGMNFDSMAALRQFVAGGGATAEGFSSLGDDMARSFIGTIKTEFAGVVGLFADMGEPLLGPFRDAFVQISRIIKSDLMGMMQIIQRFGAESFAPTLVTIIDKTSEFIRSNIVNNLQDVEQMGKNFVEFFRNVRDFFGGIGDALRAMEPAANVVIDMFRAMGGAAGGRGLFREFRDLIVENAEAFENFGAGIGNVIGAVFDLLKGGQAGFFNSLDRISAVLNTVASELVPAIGEILNAITPALEKLPDLVSAIADGLELIAPPIELLANAVAMLVQVLGGMGGIGGLLALGGFGAFRSFRGEAQRRGMTNRMLLQERQRNFRRNGGFRGLVRSQGLGGVTSAMGMTGIGLGLTAVSGAYESGSTSMGTLGGAAGGAMLGFSIAGPLGAAAGALIGGIAGYLAGKAGQAKIAEATATAMQEHIGSLRLIGTPGALTIVETKQAITDLSTHRDIISRARQNPGIEDLRQVAEDMRTTTDGIDLASALDTTFAGPEVALEAALVAAEFGTTNGGVDIRTEHMKRAQIIMGQRAQMAGGGPGGLTGGIGATLIEGEFYQEVLRSAEMLKTFDSPEWSELTGTLQELGIIGEHFDDEEIYKNLPQYLEEDDAAIGRLEQNVRNFDSNVGMLQSTLGLTSEAVQSLAADLGINLQGRLDQQGTALLMQAALNPMDRNQTFLPDLSTSALGVQERNATASAMLEAIAGAEAGDLNTGMISDAIQAFAAYEIALGNSPDLAALSGVFELEEKLPQLTGGDPEKERILRGQIESAYGSTFRQMEEEYGIDAGRLRTIYDEAGGGSRGITALDTTLDQRKDFMDAIAGTGGMAFKERMSVLDEASGGELYKSRSLQDAFLNNLATEGRMQAERALQGGTSLADVIDAAAGQQYGEFDQQQFMTDFISMEAPLDLARNDLLSNIKAAIDMTTEAVNGINVSDPERGGTVTGIIGGSIGAKVGAGSMRRLP